MPHSHPIPPHDDAAHAAGDLRGDGAHRRLVAHAARRAARLSPHRRDADAARCRCTTDSSPCARADSACVARSRPATPPRSRCCAQHGVRVERAPTSDDATRVSEFVIDSRARAAAEFQGHHEMRLFGSWRDHGHAFPPDMLMVRGEPARRPSSALYLLDPESDDGLVTWNVFDSELAPGKLVPRVARGRDRQSPCTDAGRGLACIHGAHAVRPLFPNSDIHAATEPALSLQPAARLQAGAPQRIREAVRVALRRRRDARQRARCRARAQRAQDHRVARPARRERAHRAEGARGRAGIPHDARPHPRAEARRQRVGQAHADGARPR